MTNSVDIGQLVELAKAELAKMNSGQEFLLGDVHNMARQAYEKYREDPVIRQFAFVIEQMLDKKGNTAIVSQAELTGIYNDLVRTSENTKFRDVLGMFLVQEPQLKTASQSDDFVRMNRIDAENTQLSTDDYIDQGLVSTLVRAFGGSADEPRAYNAKAATQGKEYVELELKAMGYKPRVELVGGNANTLVYAAHVDTEHGIVSVAIPLELSSDKVLLPSTFVADNRLEELTAQKFQYFVDTKAFNKDFSMPSAKGVIAAVEMLTGLQKTASADDFESQLAAFTPERYDERGEQISLTSPELFSEKQNHPEPQPYIDTTPQVEMPKELAHLAHDFENDILEAASEHGKDAVQAGKQMLFAELSAAGFKGSQVRFAGESGDCVFYMAAVHTPRGPAEIEVPVEMKSIGSKYVPLAPTHFGWDGLIEDFTPEKLQRFALARAYPSTGETVCSTAHSYMTLPELRDEIVKAATYGDYVTAEMILGTVQDRFAEEDYRNIIADYHYILMYNQRQTQAEQKQCTKAIAAGKGSIEARCGHFGVPMSKVVVGEDGQCRLRSHLERERMNPVEDSSAAISTSKMFLS